MSDVGIAVVTILILAAAGAFMLKARRGTEQRAGIRQRPSQDTGGYPGGVYPIAADTGTRDGRGDGGGYVDPAPDAGSGAHGGAGGDSGGDGGGGGGDGGGDG